MLKKELLECFNLGNEIEFTFNNQMYFLEPDYDSIEKLGITMYKLYRCYKERSEKLIVGSIDEVLNYKFDGNNSLGNCCDSLKDYWVF